MRGLKDQVQGTMALTYNADYPPVLEWSQYCITVSGQNWKHIVDDIVDDALLLIETAIVFWHTFGFRKWS